LCRSPVLCRTGKLRRSSELRRTELRSACVFQLRSAGLLQLRRPELLGSVNLLGPGDLCRSAELCFTKL